MQIHRGFPVRDLPREESTASRSTSRAHHQFIAVRRSSSSHVAGALLAIAAAAFSSVATAAPTFDVVDLSSHSSASAFPSSEVFAGAGTTHDGRVVFAPFKFNRVGVFDPKQMEGSVEDAFKLYDTTLNAATFNFYSAISVGDGRVVFPPYDAGVVGVFDGRDDTFTMYNQDSAGNAVTFASRATIGGGVASDGKVFMCPFRDGAIKTFDLNTNTVSTSLGNAPNWVDSGWHGGSATLDGRVVCAPFFANHVLVYSPATDSSAATATSIAASVNNFVGATTLANGLVFMAPWQATAVGKFDPSASTFDTDSTILPSGDATYFGGVITAPDGRVLFQEQGSSGNTHLFDPTDDSLISVDTRYPSTWTSRVWWGASIVENLVVFAPRNIAAVGILKVSCGENEHVVSGACVQCPSGQSNQAGDPMKGPDTACDAECTCARLLNKVGLSYV